MSPWVRRALGQAAEAGRRPVQTTPDFTFGDRIKADDHLPADPRVAACRHGMRATSCRRAEPRDPRA